MFEIFINCPKVLLAILFVFVVGKFNIYSVVIVFLIMVVDVIDGLISRLLRPFCNNHRVWDSLVDKVILIVIIFSAVLARGLILSVAIILFLQILLLIAGIKLKRALEPHYLQKLALAIVGIAGISFLIDWHVNFVCWFACFSYSFSAFYYFLRCVRKH